MALSFYKLTFSASFRFQHEPIRRVHIAELNLFIFRVSFCQCYEIFNGIGLILLSIRIECNRNNNWHLHKCILKRTRHLVSANKFTNCMERNLHNNMSQTWYWFLFLRFNIDVECLEFFAFPNEPVDIDFWDRKSYVEHWQNGGRF